MAVDPNANGSTTNPGVGEHMVAAGEWTEIEAVPQDGFFFVNWDVEGDAEIKDMLSQATSVSLIGNATVTANFLPVVTTATLTLSVVPDSSGWTNPNAGAQTVPVGERIAIQAIPADGYFFEKWTSTGGAEIKDTYNDSTSVVLSADATLTANFAQAVTVAMLTAGGRSGQFRLDESRSRNPDSPRRRSHPDRCIALGRILLRKMDSHW